MPVSFGLVALFTFISPIWLTDDNENTIIFSDFSELFYVFNPQSYW